jgi:phage FluMu protein Com
MTKIISKSLDILSMLTIICNKCGEFIDLNTTNYWNVKDIDVTCAKCKAINTITIEEGELRSQR